MDISWFLNQSSVTISDPVELLVLHRAVMEAKFGRTEANDADILASPFLAALANRVVDALIAWDRAKGKGNTASRWESWRQLDPSRREWTLVQQRIRACVPWSKWSQEERDKFLDYLISPLVVSGPNREKLLLTDPT